MNLCTKDTCSPLYAACVVGNESIVHFLLKNGANVNLFNVDECSPLYAACKEGNEKLVQTLLQNKADVNFCNQHR